MRRHWMRRGFKFALVAVVAVAALGFIVMSLWNWLVPALFAGPSVGFWQAIGLFVLARLLVGGLRGRGHAGGRWRERMAERWAQMTPEEREQLRDGLRSRCGARRANAN